MTDTVIVAHPNKIRGPIEEEFNATRDQIEETYRTALADAEETYRSDLAANRAARRTALSSAGLNSQGGKPPNYPETADPENTVAPTITGTEGVGHVLTAHDGTWLHSPVITRQWEIATASRSNKANIAGATGPTYTPVAGDSGKRIRLVVTGANPEGRVVAKSAWSGILAAS